MLIICTDSPWRGNRLTCGPEQPIPELPVFLVNDDGVIVFHPPIKFLARERLADVREVSAIAGSGEQIDVALVFPFGVRTGKNQVSPAFQQPDHVSYGVIVLHYMFKHADAGYEIILLIQTSIGNVIIQHIKMSVDHASGPIIGYIVYCCDMKSTILHQMR